MVGDTPVLDMSYVAGEDLSSYQFCCVSMGNDGKMYASSTNVQTIVGVTVPTQVWGILQNDPPAGDIAVVRELGHSKAVMYSTVSPGYGLKLAAFASAGRGKLGTGTVGSDVIVAFMSQDTCGGTGEIHDVALMARCAQGASYRAGQLTYLVPMVQLGVTTGLNVLASLPLGFTGTITDMYAVAQKASSTSGATSLSLKISGSAVTGLAVSVPHASADTLSALMTSTGTAGANTFGPTDTLTIYSTPTVTWATDTGMLEVHVITN